MHGDPPKFFTGKTEAFFTLFLVSVTAASMVFVAEDAPHPRAGAPGQDS